MRSPCEPPVRGLGRALTKAMTLIVGTGVIGVCPAEHGEGGAGRLAGATEWGHSAIRHLCLVSRLHQCSCSQPIPPCQQPCLRSGATPALIAFVHQSALHRQSPQLRLTDGRQQRTGGRNCADQSLAPRSTGVGPTEFTTSLHFAKTARGRIAVDDHLRVLVHSTRPEEHGPTTPGQVR